MQIECGIKIIAREKRQRREIKILFEKRLDCRQFFFFFARFRGQISYSELTLI